MSASGAAHVAFGLMLLCASAAGGCGQKGPLVLPAATGSAAAGSAAAPTGSASAATR